jgi:putative ABC transport system permease protein
MTVTPDFFFAAGIALRKGRFTTMADAAEAPKVAVISEALARRYFANEEPVGRRIRWGGPWLTVVGVAGDVKGFGVDGPPLPAIYLPHGQQSWNNGVFVLVRTAVPPALLAATVRKEIRSWSKSILISRLAPLEDLLSASVVAPRFYMLLVAAFAAIAVVIAAVGVYATLNYLVTQRTHEIGVRMALGANRGDLLCSIVGRGLAVILTGLIFGLAGAWAFTRILESLLFRVRPNDRATFVAASLLLVAVGLLACYVPARRATKIDPMEALRYE